MDKKYELTSDSISWTHNKKDHTLYRIRALRNFGKTKEGNLGGYIESENNLSHDGYAWVGSNAKVFDPARIYGNARVFDKAEVFGNARVYGDAWVYGSANIYDNVRIYDRAKIHGNSVIHGHASIFGDAEVYGDAWVYDNSRIFDNAEVYDDSWVAGNSEVFKDARVCNDARVCGKVSMSPVCIKGLQLRVSIIDDLMTVDCYTFSLAKWDALRPDDILNLPHRHLSEWWKKYKDFILGIAYESGRRW